MSPSIRVQLKLSRSREPLVEYIFDDLARAQHYVSLHENYGLHLVIEQVEIINAQCPHCKGTGVWTEPKLIRAITVDDLREMS